MHEKKIKLQIKIKSFTDKLKMVEKIIKLNILEDISKVYFEELRFESKNLSIATGTGYRSFAELDATEQFIDGKENPIALEDVLLDTGNTLRFCLITKEFKNPFNETFFNNKLEFEKKLIGTIKDEAVIAKVTKKAYKFKLFNTYFISSIGFPSFIHKKMKTTIYVGIHSINQFLNLLFFRGPRYYYFCSNIKDS